MERIWQQFCAPISGRVIGAGHLFDCSGWRHHVSVFVHFSRHFLWVGQFDLALRFINQFTLYNSIILNL